MISGSIPAAAIRGSEGLVARQTQGSSEDQFEDFMIVLGGIGGEAKPAEDESGGRDSEQLLAPADDEKLPVPVIAAITPQDSGQLAASIQAEAEPQGRGAQPLPALMIAKLATPISLNALTPAISSAPPANPLPDDDAAENPPAQDITGGDLKHASIRITSDAPAERIESPIARPDPIRKDDSPPERDATLPLPTVGEAEVTAYPSPAIQILTQISNAVPQGQVQGMAQSPVLQVQLTDPALPSPSDVKALRIKLQPEDLGEVEVTIRRAGLQTKVTITVSGRAVADTLSMDKGFLEERLGSLFTPGTANSVLVSMEIREPGQMQEQNAVTGGSQTWQEASPGGGGFGRDGRPDQRQHQPGMTGDEHEAEDRATRVTAGNGRIV